MNTLEEKAKKYCKENGVLDSAIFSTKHGTEYTYEILADFASEYAKAQVHKALEEAAEKAQLKFHDGHFKEDKFMQHIQIGANNITVDKESILSLKDKY